MYKHFSRLPRDTSGRVGSRLRLDAYGHFFGDIHALLPVYLVTVLGASMVTVWFYRRHRRSDGLKSRRCFPGRSRTGWASANCLPPLAMDCGIHQPIFPLAPSISWLVAARFIDRIGKGIRGAPRDALVADIAPAHLRGASFGLRQSLDTVGAFVGPALAIGLMWLSASNFRRVLGCRNPGVSGRGTASSSPSMKPERPSGLRKCSRL